MENDLPTCHGVIFDLDGTLLDTLGDLSAAANAVLKACGYPEHPEDRYRDFVGRGVRRLFQRALPPEHCSDRDIARAVAAMRSHYARCWACRTRPYPGIPAMLYDLKQGGVPMAVFSNKDETFVQRIVEHFFGSGIFLAVRGARQGQPLKPAPDGALALANELGCAPGNVWLLGDSDVDIDTAQAAGMASLGAAWGFRGAGELRSAGALHILRHPGELSALCRDARNYGEPRNA